MSKSVKENYEVQIKLKIKEELALPNLMAVPVVKKIIVSAGVGRFKDDSKMIESTINDLKIITGQLPKITRAKIAISAFKLRANEVVGLVVTLRGQRMWSFLDKLMNVVLPRVRDFRGISKSSFDGQGNLSLGFSDHSVFPEIDVNRIDKPKGFGITIVTSADSDDLGFNLLCHLGFPFRKD